jgi:hypothetical protein
MSAVIELTTVLTTPRIPRLRAHDNPFATACPEVGTRRAHNLV